LPALKDMDNCPNARLPLALQKNDSRMPAWPSLSRESESLPAPASEPKPQEKTLRRAARLAKTAKRMVYRDARAILQDQDLQASEANSERNSLRHALNAARQAVHNALKQKHIVDVLRSEAKKSDRRRSIRILPGLPQQGSSKVETTAATTAPWDEDFSMIDWQTMSSRMQSAIVELDSGKGSVTAQTIEEISGSVHHCVQVLETLKHTSTINAENCKIVNHGHQAICDTLEGLKLNLKGTLWVLRAKNVMLKSIAPLKATPADAERRPVKEVEASFEKDLASLGLLDDFKATITQKGVLREAGRHGDSSALHLEVTVADNAGAASPKGSGLPCGAWRPLHRALLQNFEIEESGSDDDSDSNLEAIEFRATELEREVAAGQQFIFPDVIEAMKMDLIDSTEITPIEQLEREVAAAQQLIFPDVIEAMKIDVIDGTEIDPIEELERELAAAQQLLCPDVIEAMTMDEIDATKIDPIEVMALERQDAVELDMLEHVQTCPGGFRVKASPPSSDSLKMLRRPWRGHATSPDLVPLATPEARTSIKAATDLIVEQPQPELRARQRLSKQSRHSARDVSNSTRPSPRLPLPRQSKQRSAASASTVDCSPASSRGPPRQAGRGSTAGTFFSQPRGSASTVVTSPASSRGTPKHAGRASTARASF